MINGGHIKKTKLSSFLHVIFRSRLRGTPCLLTFFASLSLSISLSEREESFACPFILLYFYLAQRWAKLMASHAAGNDAIPSTQRHRRSRSCRHDATYRYTVEGLSPAQLRDLLPLLCLVINLNLAIPHQAVRLPYSAIHSTRRQWQYQRLHLSPAASVAGVPIDRNRLGWRS